MTIPGRSSPKSRNCIAIRTADAMRQQATERQAQIDKWRIKNPELAQELDRYIKGEIPAIDYSRYSTQA